MKAKIQVLIASIALIGITVNAKADDNYNVIVVNTGAYYPTGCLPLPVLPIYGAIQCVAYYPQYYPDYYYTPVYDTGFYPYYYQPAPYYPYYYPPAPAYFLGGFIAGMAVSSWYWNNSNVWYGGAGWNAGYWHGDNFNGGYWHGANGGAWSWSANGYSGGGYCHNGECHHDNNWNGATQLNKSNQLKSSHKAVTNVRDIDNRQNHNLQNQHISQHPRSYPSQHMNAVHPDNYGRQMNNRNFDGDRGFGGGGRGFGGGGHRR